MSRGRASKPDPSVTLCSCGRPAYINGSVHYRELDDGTTIPVCLGHWDTPDGKPREQFTELPETPAVAQNGAAGQVEMFK